MLHCVCDIRGLNQVVNHDSCLAVDSVVVILILRRLTESHGPVHIVRHVLSSLWSIHDRVDNQLAGPLKLGFGGVDSTMQINVLVVHEQFPTQINRVLHLLLDKLRVGHAGVVCIVDQGRKHTSKLGQRIV